MRKRLHFVHCSRKEEGGGRKEKTTEIQASYTVFIIKSLVLEAYLLLNFVDFCHDSANHASMVALAAPKVLASCFLPH